MLDNQNDLIYNPNSLKSKGGEGLNEMEKTRAEEIMELMAKMPEAAADYLRGYMQGVIDSTK